MLHVAGLDTDPDRARAARRGGDAVDGSIDYPRIDKFGEKLRARSKRTHENSVIDFIDVVFIQRQTIEHAARAGTCANVCAGSSILHIRQVDANADDGE